jgi:hypothetical protein
LRTAIGSFRRLSFPLPSTVPVVMGGATHPKAASISGCRVQVGCTLSQPTEKPAAVLPAPSQAELAVMVILPGAETHQIGHQSRVTV